MVIEKENTKKSIHQYELANARYYEAIATKYYEN